MSRRCVADPSHHDVAMEHHLAGCVACQEEADSLIALLSDEPSAG